MPAEALSDGPSSCVMPITWSSCRSRIPAVVVVRVERVDDKAPRAGELSEKLLRGVVVIDQVRNGQLGILDQDGPDLTWSRMARIGKTRASDVASTSWYPATLARAPG